MISIVIPLYFSDVSQYQTIKRCFDSIMPPVPKVKQNVSTVHVDTHKTDYETLQLIVIDDCSPLNTDDFFVTKRNKINKGYTATVNEGLKMAKGDILVIANQDIVFTPEFLTKLHEIEFGIYSPKTTDEGAGDKFGSIWGMSRNTYNLLGKLDESMKHFFSDRDYYTRAQESGVPVIKWPIIVEHEGSNAYKHTNKNSLYLKDMETYRKKYGRVD